jgi:hypothetical protein
MEEGDSFETLEILYRITGCHVPENRIFYELN